MGYRVDWLTRWEQLLPYMEVWNRLAGFVPFRRWEWLAGWWRHYGLPEQGRRQLAVGVVKNPSGQVIGLAPWYLERSILRGRRLRFLGDGEVCSDHLSLLCQPGQAKLVAEALAESLLAALISPSACTRSAIGSDSAIENPIEKAHHQTGSATSGVCLAEGLACPFRWDLLELADVDGNDPVLEAFAQAMAKRGCRVDRAPAGHCWVIDLPPTWESFLQMLSHSHRHRLRRIDKRFFAAGRAVLHTVSEPEQLPWAMDLLVQLHRQRRRQLGQPDQFVSSRFETFHRQIAPSLLEAGLLELHWLEVEGQPVAAEYHLVGNSSVYAYQCGIGPTALCPSPGEWLHLALIRRAIQLGYQKFDFLRGDEPYKAHWRAQARPTETIWIAAPHTGARWRHALDRTARRLKSWLRGWLGRHVKSPVSPCQNASDESAVLPEQQNHQVEIREQTSGVATSTAAPSSSICQEGLEEARLISAKDARGWTG